MENRYLSLARVIIRHCESRGSVVGCCRDCDYRTTCDHLLGWSIPMDVGVFEVARLIQENQEGL